jgi:hypothetical protein
MSGPGSSFHMAASFDGCTNRGNRLHGLPRDQHRLSLTLILVYPTYRPRSKEEDCRKGVRRNPEVYAKVSDPAKWVVWGPYAKAQGVADVLDLAYMSRAPQVTRQCTPYEATTFATISQQQSNTWMVQTLCGTIRRRHNWGKRH